MRDLSRRLAALETRPGNHGFRCVVIVSGDDPSPPDSDDIHIIRIVAADFPHVDPATSLHAECGPLSEMIA
jgi:hypothetical protein